MHSDGKYNGWSFIYFYLHSSNIFKNQKQILFEQKQMKPNKPLKNQSLIDRDQMRNPKGTLKHRDKDDGYKNQNHEKIAKIINNKYSGSQSKEKLQFNDSLNFKDRISRNKSQDLLLTNAKINPNNQQDRSEVKQAQQRSVNFQFFEKCREYENKIEYLEYQIEQLQRQKKSRNIMNDQNSDPFKSFNYRKTSQSKIFNLKEYEIKTEKQNQQIKQIENKVKELKNKYKKEKRLRKDLKQKNQILNEKWSQQSRILNETQASIQANKQKHLEQQIANLLNELKGSQVARQNLENEKKGYVDLISQLQSQIKSIENLNVNLQINNSEMKKAIQKLEQGTKELQKIQSKQQKQILSLKQLLLLKDNQALKNKEQIEKLNYLIAETNIQVVREKLKQKEKTFQITDQIVRPNPGTDQLTKIIIAKDQQIQQLKSKNSKLELDLHYFHDEISNDLLESDIKEKDKQNRIIRLNALLEEKLQLLQQYQNKMKILQQNNHQLRIAFEGVISNNPEMTYDQLKKQILNCCEGKVKRHNQQLFGICKRFVLKLSQDNIVRDNRKYLSYILTLCAQLVKYTDQRYSNIIFENQDQCQEIHRNEEAIQVPVSILQESNNQIQSQCEDLFIQDNHNQLRLNFQKEQPAINKKSLLLSEDFNEVFSQEEQEDNILSRYNKGDSINESKRSKGHSGGSREEKRDSQLGTSAVRIARSTHSATQQLQAQQIYKKDIRNIKMKAKQQKRKA